MKFKVFLISFFILSGFQCARAALEYTYDDAQKALKVLDDSLVRRDEFIEHRQADIDKLVGLLKTKSDSAELLMQIAERYTAFNNDSALHYLKKGSDLAQGKDKIPFTLKQAALLPLNGMFETAIKLYDSYIEDSIPPQMRALYYESGRQMYSYLANFSADGSSNQSLYNEKALERQQRLLDMLSQDSQEYRYHLGEYFFQTGQKGKARALLEEVFETEPIQSNLRARSAHHLSTIALEENDDNAYVYFIAGAALADITAATREVAALQELGNYLYTQNDIDRSYNYLITALMSAVECGAPLRMEESSRLLPIIEHAKQAQLNSKKKTIYIIVGILIIISVGLAVSLLILHLKMKRLRTLQESLKMANKTKDIYISQFLSICSIYMDKLNQFCKMVNRKITAGKIDDLYRITKSGKFIEEQSKEFFDVFDTAFLHMYPNFPEKVNALLRPNERIELKEGELLNTDLRILAFMRLGIDESNRIAQILNYSVNTIYAYRNRTKARAINRDTFEEDVMEIDSTF